MALDTAASDTKATSDGQTAIASDGAHDSVWRLEPISRKIGRQRDHFTKSAGTVLSTLARVVAPVSDPVGRWFATGAVARFITSSLLRRIVLSNMIGLLVLLVGSVYVSKHQAWLIDAKRESLEAQGHIIAAAIVSNAKIEDRDLVLDPDKLQVNGSGAAQAAPIPFRDDAFSSLELSLGPEQIAPILRRVMQGTKNRARIYARDGTIILDSESLALPGLKKKPAPAVGANDRPKVRDFWTRLIRIIVRSPLDVYKEIEGVNGQTYDAIRTALQGTSRPMVMLTSSGEQIVAVAVPLSRMGAVHGAMLLSTRPGEIDGIIWEERLKALALAALAIAATVIAALLLARTVARPMRELSEAAEHVSRDINASTELPDFGDRQDEVGQLSRAFHNMTAALYRRIDASEKFAADVAHELKNPLTAARSTAESLSYARTDAQRDQLVVQIQVELKRLNRLITDVSNASRLDAELALQQSEPVRVEKILRELVETFQDIISETDRKISLTVAPSALGDRCVISGHTGRIAQVFTNLIDNALSFSPDDGEVSIALWRDGKGLGVSIEDQGPGVPEDKLETIFSRFYTYRPTADSSRGNNSGLGLSISREIVRAHHGEVWAENKPSGGARFVVRLPTDRVGSNRRGLRQNAANTRS